MAPLAARDDLDLRHTSALTTNRMCVLSREIDLVLESWIITGRFSTNTA